MLEALSKGFRNAKLKLQGKVELNEDNIKHALRDVRVSLLEADVEISVVKGFLSTVRERALGDVVRLKFNSQKKGKMKVSPADHFIKICHEELVNLMGPVDTSLNLGAKPSLIMMVGLQGSGKTTTSGKLAKRLLAKGHKPMLVAADIYRPAAIEQLDTLGRTLDIPVFSIRGLDPVTLCTMAVEQARSVGRDVVIFDTAGRLAIDNKLMQELLDIKAKTNPQNIFFVCDSMIGQNAVQTAKAFDQLLDFSGFILTKLDGDARGGAALSIKSVTGKPIKFLGMGEGLGALEDFRPEGLADRILGFGDVVGLMNDFEKVTTHEAAEKDAKKMLSGDFNFDDFTKQLKMIKKMGSLRSLFEKIPGMGNMMSQLPKEALDDRELMKVQSMIQSMTKQERRDPDIIDASRIRRIAKGSGRTTQDVQDLYERFLQARAMMVQMGQSGMMNGMMGKQGRSARRGGGGPMGFPPGMGGFPPGMGGMGNPMMGGMGNPMGGFPGMGNQTKKSNKNSDKRLAEARKKRKMQKANRKKNRK